MNPFQLSYYERLQSWVQLRDSLDNATPQQICIAVDEWWQRAPLVNHYLHPLEIQSWPDPWTLLHENMYCPVARALGMCYTLLLLGVDYWRLGHCADECGDEYTLILVDRVNCVMNYHPGCVVNTALQQFTIRKYYDTASLASKIR